MFGGGETWTMDPHIIRCVLFGVWCKFAFLILWSFLNSYLELRWWDFRFFPLLEKTHTSLPPSPSFPFLFSLPFFFCIHIPSLISFHSIDAPVLSIFIGSVFFTYTASLWFFFFCLTKPFTGILGRYCGPVPDHHTEGSHNLFDGVSCLQLVKNTTSVKYNKVKCN